MQPFFIQILGLLLFPLALGGTLFGLQRGVYRRLADVNDVFRAGWRAPGLAALLGGVSIVALGVYLAVQAVRVPFVVRVIDYITHEQTPMIARVGMLGFGVGLGCEALVLLHLLIYLRVCRRDARYYRSPQPGIPSDPLPAVAVLIPSCNESHDVLERSLGSLGRLKYHPLQVLLVDNSTDPDFRRIAHEVAAAHCIEVADIPNRGSKAAALNDARPWLRPEVRYVVVLDVDQSLEFDLVSDIVPLLEEDPGLGWIQTAQTYENALDSLLACASAQQQMLVYDCVIGGKSVLERAPCFGTNFVMRLSALDMVGGWIEDNVTEDLATSYQLHAHGWRSRYLRRIYAAGLAPATLDAYWRQQQRWATGNSSVALSILPHLVCPHGVPRSVVADYLWSAGFYLNTILISFLALMPTALLVIGMLTGIGLRAFDTELTKSEWIFASLYSLYVILLFFPYVNMRMRGYPLRNMLLVQALTAITSPIYLRGVLRSLFGGRTLRFERSRRAASMADRTPPLWRAPQTLALAVFTLTGTGFTALAVAHPANPFAWIIVLWCYVHALSLGHFILFRGTGTPAYNGPSR